MGTLKVNISSLKVFEGMGGPLHRAPGTVSSSQEVLKVSDSYPTPPVLTAGCKNEDEGFRVQNVRRSSLSDSCTTSRVSGSLHDALPWSWLLLQHCLPLVLI